MDKFEQYERVFNHFDCDGDGRISSAELRQCMVSIGGDMTAEEADEAVALMDSDGDRLLCLEDFVRIVEAAGEDEKQSDLRAAFQLYTAVEGSAAACITAESLKKMLHKLGQSTSVRHCRNMIATFDLNGDGVLNFDEFKMMMSC